MIRTRRAFSWVEALVVIVVLIVLLLLLFPVLVTTRNVVSRSKCSSSLRQLALGAAAYAGDHGAYPHVRGLKDLDSNWTGQDSLRIAAGLIHLGYTDSPEIFICPDSSDPPNVPPPGTPFDRSTWTFGPTGTTRPPSSPLDGQSDLGTKETLVTTNQLSYGWSRRIMNSNAASSLILGADRALRVNEDPAVAKQRPPGTWGNHLGG